MPMRDLFLSSRVQVLVFSIRLESGAAAAHFKMQPRRLSGSQGRPRFGVRQCSALLEFGQSAGFEVLYEGMPVPLTI